MNKIFFWITILFVSFFYSCEVINPAEDIPSYIQIDTIDFQSQAAEYGTSSHNIKDCWVYVNRDFIGCFELPAKIPVLKSGNCEIVVRGGIKLNGIASSRIVNPFYSNYTIYKNLKVGEVTLIDSAILKYNKLDNIIWQEDFEYSVLTLKNSNNADTLIRSNENLLFVPNDNKINFINYHSGLVNFTDTSYFEAITKNAYKLPKTLDDVVLLELNYCTNQLFEVGVCPENGNINNPYKYPVLIVNSSGMKWNKIYINLSNAVTTFSQVDNFYIYFSASKSKDVSSPVLLFDNIKLLKY